MHFYPHHIGDYQRDTGHLSVLEHGAYRLLMDAYYVTERPLPADKNALCRIVRAMTKLERDAVAAVAQEFFIDAGDGTLRHKRIESELAEYHANAEKNRINGRLGGRPKKNPDGNPNKTQEKPSGFHLGFPNGTQPITQTKANQEPRTKNQLPPSPLKGEGAQAPDGELLKLDIDDSPPSPKPKPEKLTDPEWIASLGKLPAYEGIDVSREVSRCEVWCQLNQKKFSRRRVVSWLNRTEKPILNGGYGRQPVTNHQPPRQHDSI